MGNVEVHWGDAVPVVAPQLHVDTVGCVEHESGAILFQQSEAERGNRADPERVALKDPREPVLKVARCHIGGFTLSEAQGNFGDYVERVEDVAGAPVPRKASDPLPVAAELDGRIGSELSGWESERGI